MRGEERRSFGVEALGDMLQHLRGVLELHRKEKRGKSTKKVSFSLKHKKKKREQTLVGTER